MLIFAFFEYRKVLQTNWTYYDKIGHLWSQIVMGKSIIAKRNIHIQNSIYNNKKIL